MHDSNLSGPLDIICTGGDHIETAHGLIHVNNLKLCKVMLEV